MPSKMCVCQTTLVDPGFAKRGIDRKRWKISVLSMVAICSSKLIVAEVILRKMANTYAMYAMLHMCNYTSGLLYILFLKMSLITY